MGEIAADMCEGPLALAVGAGLQGGSIDQFKFSDGFSSAGPVSSADQSVFR